MEQTQLKVFNFGSRVSDFIFKSSIMHRLVCLPKEMLTIDLIIL